MNPPTKKPIKNLRKLRKDSGYSQDKLAKILNVSRSTIAMWEKGYNNPGYGYVISIAEIFNTTTDYLLGRVDDPSIPNAPVVEDGDEVYEMRRAMAERPEMRTYFSLVKTAKKADLEFVNEFLKRVDGTGRENE